MTKHSIKLSDMLNLNMAILGIEFCWALILTNSSAIYSYFGVHSALLPYTWLAAPILGLTIQPIVGNFSDHTHSRYGRRRPYILGGVMFIFLLCLLLPRIAAPYLGIIIFWLIIAVVNFAHQPMRTLVADITPPEQSTTCFGVQTIMIGLASIVATALPWLLNQSLHLSGSTVLNRLPNIISIPFYIGGTMALLAGCWTVYRIKEAPSMGVGQRSSRELVHIILTPFKALVSMSSTMIKLSLVQVFIWLSLFTFFVYFPIGIAQNLYHVPPNANINASHTYKTLFNLAVIHNSRCLTVFQMAAIFVALSLPWITRLIARKYVLSITLIIAALGLIMTNYTTWGGYIPNAIAVGLAWGCILSIPYAMLATNTDRTKLGLNIGLLNIFTCLPQIVMGLLIAPLSTHVFHGHAMKAIAACGIFLMIAAVINASIRDQQS